MLIQDSGRWNSPATRFSRLPFGITSTPEHFQKRMSDIVSGLEGVVCQVDDILVFGETQEEHDRYLTAVLVRIMEEGLTFNREKCQFNRASIKFLGQVVDGAGIRPDPDKLVAIQEMKPPTNITDLRRFIGMANQLTKFSQRLTDRMKPLRDLLSTKPSGIGANLKTQPSVQTDRRSSELLRSFGQLRRYKRDSCVSRRLILRPRRGLETETTGWEPPSNGLHFQSHDGNGEEICSN